MRIERISNDQFTIFLPFEDLVERGFTKEDLWHDASSVEDLFSDMMYEASSELDFELDGTLLIQVHLMQAQGMHVVVTQQFEELDEDLNDEIIIDDFIEMKVTLDESNELIYLFNEFESVIQVSSHLKVLEVEGGQVYYMDGIYYMLLDEIDFKKQNKEDLIAVMSEFSQPSIVTSYRLNEYGKVIYASDAVNQITEVFDV